MLHQTTKKKAVTKYRNLLNEGATNENITALMDEEEFTVEDKAEIFAAIAEPVKSEQRLSTNGEKVFDPQNPNSIINNDFDYANLVGDEFKRYLAELEALDPSLGFGPHSNDTFWFDKYMAKPVRKVRFEGMDGSPVDFIGIQLRSLGDKTRYEPPIVSTRISIKNARTLNEQIVNAHAIAGYGNYYLLKKF
ncbi:MAG: hypothetical protein JWR61_5657 [Ferruginibacter sp.]|uniref:hypothetical protein n=1 Tax=Ferruginibacter sp. TaxID=1940288 RepID=UPI002658EE20|nr:hypothetical protein [Ferruginibacter sp.]MDB5280702.1 hypothetical protein [Ferruginibacter sp.]